MTDNQSILIVDDSKLSQVMMKKAVNSYNEDWEITVASNAEEALKAYEKSASSIAILDYNMPGMNGLDLATNLRQRNLKIPIALVTANIQAAIQKQAENIGVVFIPKPIKEAAIHAYLKSAISQLG